MRPQLPPTRHVEIISKPNNQDDSNCGTYCRAMRQRLGSETPESIHYDIGRVNEHRQRKRHDDIVFETAVRLEQTIAGSTADVSFQRGEDLGKVRSKGETTDSN